MGVNDLWQILEPVKRHAPLRSLQGKTLAVDLSLWVCEALAVKKMVGIVVKPHLRNLFFRISSLTLMEVKLLFVMEGDAPKLKADVMGKRNETRFGAPQNRAHKFTRSSFKAVLKECLDLLECLGVPWVQASGEAEAMCAYLDAHGYVDGCLTDDGDAFLYGAQTVYRNFTMNAKDPHVDCYTMSSIKRDLGLDRDTLIGLAVLLGCDYLPKGVPGVGKELALKLVRSLKGQNLLQKFDQWKEESHSPDLPPAPVRKPAHCNVCAHPGSPGDHELRGCRLCGSERYCEPHDPKYRCLCDWHRAEHRRLQGAAENSVKKKACACQGFPFPEVIREFQVNKDRVTKKICFRRPDLLSFQIFALEKLEWPRHYACEKLMGLLAHHDMVERKLGHKGPAQLRPLRITRSRLRSGVPCLEILWQKPEHYVMASAAPQAGPLAVLTVEEAALFEAAYPEVVAQYQEQLQENQGKKSKSKKNKDKGGDLLDVGEVTGLLAHVRLSHEMGPGQAAKAALKAPPEEEWPQRNSPVGGSRLWSGAPLSLEAWQLPAPTPTPASTPTPLRLGGSQHGWASSHLLSMSELQDDSSAIEALQLSTIDWEGTSFSVSPGAHSSGPSGDSPHEPQSTGSARTHSSLGSTLQPLKEWGCAQPLAQPQLSAPDGRHGHWADPEASALQRKGAFTAKSGPSFEPQQPNCSPPGLFPVFRLQSSLDQSDMASRRAPRAGAFAPLGSGNPTLRPLGRGLPRLHPEAQATPKRFPKKTVCLPCSSSEEEDELTSRSEKCLRPKGKPEQRPPAWLQTSVPRPDPRTLCKGAGAPCSATATSTFDLLDAAGSSLRPGLCPSPPGETKAASLLLESPLPLAQRLKLRFQSS
ncbi:flap endonuclease GEN homolog 1 isoform X1 [Sarcophilus harrisii]|nr:flap endonuclease GEN homolog 1 isoform X1 [Sarcophilus harrisii]XP_031805464.1 flap endonuclease GEN homolog 1 isoform X1 [Sarcophilus harrisii]